MFAFHRAISGLAAMLLFSAVGSAHSLPVREPSAVTIRNDRGGQVINYALRMLRVKEAGRSVRFSGRCDSACTLYLALPRSRTCISQGASFGFHLPYGASPAGNRIAARYLLSSYPGWVKSWIQGRGGLSGQIKTMSYAYASQYLPTCSPARKKFVLPELRPAR
jgi:hypothetical protein